MMKYLLIALAVYWYATLPKKGLITMSLDELIAEHRRLVGLLKASDRPEDQAELTEQTKELEHYINLKKLQG